MDGIVGFIRPPPDIRAIVDKTAAFVARMGDEVEAKLAAAEVANLKFGFLRTDDPYHAYYRHKVVEGRTGVKADEPAAAAAASGPTTTMPAAPAAPLSAVAPAADAAPVAAPAGATETRSVALPNPLARALRAFDPSVPAPEDEFRVPTPAFASAADVESIRVTAQFTAASGRAFLAALTPREGGNADFAFLRPSHALFSFFTALVDSYARLLRPPTALLDRLRLVAETPDALLERCVARMEHARIADEAARAAVGAGAEGAVVSINWHDFTVVETIEFDDEADVAAEAAEESAAAAEDANAGGGGGRGRGCRCGRVCRRIDKNPDRLRARSGPSAGRSDAVYTPDHRCAAAHQRSRGYAARRAHGPKVARRACARRRTRVDPVHARNGRGHSGEFARARGKARGHFWRRAGRRGGASLGCVGGACREAIEGKLIGTILFTQFDARARGI